MGHLIFIVLHVVALAFFAVALIVTISLHLIYAAASGKASSLYRGSAPSSSCRNGRTR